MRIADKRGECKSSGKKRTVFEAARFLSFTLRFPMEKSKRLFGDIWKQMTHVYNLFIHTFEIMLFVYK